MDNIVNLAVVVFYCQFQDRATLIQLCHFKTYQYAEITQFQPALGVRQKLRVQLVLKLITQDSP